MLGETSRDVDLVVAGFPVRDGQTLLVRHKKLDRWLPPGGHIESNETPDEAIKREIREELGMDVTLLPPPSLAEKGQVRYDLSRPFHVNLHDVGDHDHCCFFYVCRPEQDGFVPKRDEISQARWFSEDELEADYVPDDVVDLGKMALQESHAWHRSQTEG